LVIVRLAGLAAVGCAGCRSAQPTDEKMTTDGGSLRLCKVVQQNRYSVETNVKKKPNLPLGKRLPSAGSNNESSNLDAAVQIW
jgi:hypothetical protein